MILAFIAPVVSVFALTYVIKQTIEDKKRHSYIKKVYALEGRIVKMSKKFRKTEKVPATYATIDGSFDYDVRKKKLKSFYIRPLYDPKFIKDMQKEVREKNKKIEEQNNKIIAKFNKENPDRYIREAHAMGTGGGGGSYMPGYNSYQNSSFINSGIQRPILESYVSEGQYYDTRWEIDWKDCKLMPRGFDYVSETIIKKLHEVPLRGGEKKVTRMPRLFRFVIYLGLVILIWSILMDITMHLNDIVYFTVHLFVHK